MHIRVISILCPKCGAGIRFYERDRVIKCLHCGMHFIPVHSEGIERYYFAPQKEDPWKKVENFLKNRGFKKDDYRIVDTDNFFLPVWKGIGEVTGWISGLSPRKSVTYTEMVVTPNGGQIPIKRKREEGGIPIKKLMKIEKELLFDAVKFPDIRWSNEEVINKEYAPFLNVYNEERMKGWGKIVTPDVPPRIEKKDIRSRFIKSSLALYIDYKPLRQRLKVIGERVFLYYFPVTLLKVTLNNRLVSFTVNGLSGKVTSNSFIRKRLRSKGKKSLLLDTILIFLISLLSASLIHTKNPIFNQTGFVIIFFTFLYIWIKR